MDLGVSACSGGGGWGVGVVSGVCAGSVKRRVSNSHGRVRSLEPMETISDFGGGDGGLMYQPLETVVSRPHFKP